MTIDELIAAMEKAEGPSRELDAEIAAMFLDTQPAHPFADGTIWVEGCGSESSRTIHSRNYTRSLDAALTLAPTASDWVVEMNPESGFHANVWSLEKGWNYGSSSATAAIALCIAALKARRNT